MIAFKTLDRNGKSPVRGFQWPRPSGDSPGDWVEVAGDIVLCHNGLHGWKTLEVAQRRSTEAGIFEMEIEGDIVSDHEKVAGRRARLLRVVPRERGELAQRGTRICKLCGKPHNLYRFGKSQSWADPDDGHFYYGESSDEQVARLLATVEDWITVYDANEKTANDWKHAMGALRASLYEFTDPVNA